MERQIIVLTHRNPEIFPSYAWNFGTSSGASPCCWLMTEFQASFIKNQEINDCLERGLFQELSKAKRRTADTDQCDC